MLPLLLLDIGWNTALNAPHYLHGSHTHRDPIQCHHPEIRVQAHGHCINGLCIKIRKPQNAPFILPIET